MIDSRRIESAVSPKMKVKLDLLHPLLSELRSGMSGSGFYEPDIIHTTAQDITL
jgi:hypothetical protein